MYLGQVCLYGLTVCKGIYGGTKYGVPGFLIELLIYRKKIVNKAKETEQKELRKERVTQLSGIM